MDWIHRLLLHNGVKMLILLFAFIHDDVGLHLHKIFIVLFLILSNVIIIVVTVPVWLITNRLNIIIIDTRRNICCIFYYLLFRPADMRAWRAPCPGPRPPAWCWLLLISLIPKSASFQGRSWKYNLLNALRTEILNLPKVCLSLRSSCDIPGVFEISERLPVPAVQGPVGDTQQLRGALHVDLLVLYSLQYFPKMYWWIIEYEVNAAVSWKYLAISWNRMKIPLFCEYSKTRFRTLFLWNIVALKICVSYKISNVFFNRNQIWLESIENQTEWEASEFIYIYKCLLLMVFPIDIFPLLQMLLKN